MERMDAPLPSGMDAAPAPAAFEPLPPARSRIVALLNQKGGVGKTTTTVNLAAAFSERGRRILLVDLDPQAHLTLHFGLEPDDSTLTVYDLLLDPEVKAEDVILPARPNIDVMLSEVDLAAAEVELAGRPGRECILRDKLAAVVDRYELVMFDCPPSLGLLTLSGLACAGSVLVPMQAHFLPLQGVGKLLETVGLVRSAVNPSLEVAGIILCAHEGNTTLAREIVADLESFFENARGQEVAWRDCRILEPAIRRNIKLAEAPSFGQTIFDYAPWCAGANDYRALAEGLEAQWFGGPGSAVAPMRSREPATHRAIEVKAPPRVAEHAVAAEAHLAARPLPDDSPDVMELANAIDSLDRAFNTCGLPFQSPARTAGPSIANL
jgi:chromosome partitioning protein